MNRGQDDAASERAAVEDQASGWLDGGSGCPLRRRRTCVTLARLTPRWRARAARLSTMRASSSDW